jgi:hypothetical protein
MQRELWDIIDRTHMDTEEAVQPRDTTVAHGDTIAVAEPEAHGDEFMVLIVGFAIGMMIAFGFLIYIVLSAAGFLT